MISFVNNAGLRKIKRGLEVKMRIFISRHLLKAGLPVDAVWQVRITAQKKGTDHTPSFATRERTDRNTVELEIKPDGNDTAHLVELIPPKGVTSEETFEALERHFPSSLSRRHQLEQRRDRLEGHLSTIENRQEKLFEELEVLSRQEKKYIAELQEIRSELETLEPNGS